MTHAKVLTLKETESDSKNHISERKRGDSEEV